MAERRSRRG